MIHIYRDDQTEILRLNKNEELIASLSKFTKAEKIKSATFTLIGASSSVVLSFYNLSTKSYQNKSFDEDLEIASVIGNIVWMDTHVKIHAHGTFSRDDYSVIGGHIQNLIISGTGEIHLTKLDKKLNRTFDKDCGLYLLEES